MKKCKLDNKYLYFIIIVLIIVLIVLIVKYKDKIKEKFSEYFESFNVTTYNGNNFKQIGSGPAIVKSVMDKWLSNSPKIDYINHEGVNIPLTPEEYKTINGFIPPSFEYFPFGIDDDSYKPLDTTEFNNNLDNTESIIEQGRAKCLQACIDTNCLAVQTEVPQLCSEERTTTKVPDGFSVVGNALSEFMVTKGDCKGKPSHGCTLFYNTVEEADDGYYKLAVEDPENYLGTDKFYCGRKYYDLNNVPDLTPNPNLGKSSYTKKLPSQETVKWCPPEITKPTDGNIYSSLDQNNKCTCKAQDLNCEDPNCCRYRKLLTTEHSKYNTPYYYVPLNAASLDLGETGTSAVCKAKDHNGKCCGICFNSNKNKYELVSCPPNKQYYDGFKEDNNNIKWWTTDVETYQCKAPPSGAEWWNFVTPVGWVAGVKDRLEELSESTCVENYLETLDDPAKDKAQAYNELFQCCRYLDQACIGSVVQPDCILKDGVKYGCYGDPKILNVDDVKGSGIAACSDNTVIDPNNRCIQDSEGKLCDAFPYGCESGALWVPFN